MNAAAGKTEERVVPIREATAPSGGGDEFLAAADLVPVQREAAERSRQLALGDFLIARICSRQEGLAVFVKITLRGENWLVSGSTAVEKYE